MNSLLRIIPVVLSRLVFIGFAVIATISIPEARKLLNEDYERDGDTLLIPMKICKPTGITLEDKTVTLDAEEGDECTNMDFLANACAMSFIFSIVATAIFVISDLVVRRFSMGNSGVVAGMGLFLVFILLQTAVCTWALASESFFWIGYMSNVFEDHFQEYGIENVTTHGNTWILTAAGGSAALSAALLVLEALLSLCCSSTKKRDKADAGTDEKATTSDSQLPEVSWSSPTMTELSGSDGIDSGRSSPTDVESEAKHAQPAWNGWANPF